MVPDQDVWENDRASSGRFVKMGPTLTYQVALDEKVGSEKGKDGGTWMEPQGQRHRIPTAFLVDPKGQIAWISHPMTLEGRCSPR